VQEQETEIWMTDDDNDIDRILTPYCEKICCIVVGTSAEDMDESGMAITDVHDRGNPICNRDCHMRAPNPWALAGLSLSSFIVFFTVLKHREKSHPASLQPRQLDHPLVPPRHQ
jgi:hypothetical protein